MKRFWQHNHGSVSVYFIMLLIPIFLFQALFVDLIRIRLASRESELLVKSGLRSVMSRYNPALTDYGLYGLAWEDGASSLALFEAGIGGSLEQTDESGFQYLSLALKEGESGLKPVYTLANPVVLKRQIIQEMKIKAPVEFLSELVDKFQKNGATKVFQQTGSYWDQAEKLEELHRQREQALDRAWAASQEMIEAANEEAQRADQEARRLEELAQRMGGRTKEEITLALANIEQAIGSLTGQMASIQSSINSHYQTLIMLSQAGDEAAESVRVIISAIQNLQKALADASGQLQQYSQEKEELARLLEDMAEYAVRFAAARTRLLAGEERIRTLFNKVSAALQEAEDFQRQWQEELDKLRKSAEGDSSLPEELFWFESFYDYAYFTSYKTDAAKVPAAFTGLRMRWEEVEWWHTAKWEELWKEAEELTGQIQAFQSKWSGKETERQARNGEQEQQEKAHRNTIETATAAFKAAVNPCTGSSDAYASLYDRLEGEDGLADKYRSYSQLIVNEGYEPNIPKGATASIGKGMELLQQIGGFLTGIRDETIINEYLLDKFSYRTTGLDPEGLASAVKKRSQPEQHALKRQEAEYALYGFNSCAANQTAAYSELFLVLFGIRTVEAMLEPRTQALQAGSPLLAILAAAAEGAVKAVADAKTLTDGGTVPLLKKFGNFRVTYKDFLRIFLLIHPNQNGVLTRIQALLELNTGVDLTTATTYVEGTGVTTVKLWFVPAMLKIWNKTTGLGCQVDAGRCQISTKAVYSYD